MADDQASLDRAWRRGVTLAATTVILAAALLGFLVVPAMQAPGAGLNLYDAICRAFGIAPGSPAQPTPPSDATPQPVTTVAWNDASLGALFGGNRAAGGLVAEERCIACHAADGSSADPTIPRLAGQSAFAIYKQLHDYRSGARANETMSAMVQELTDRQVADLATFYSNLVRGSLDRQSPSFIGVAEALVIDGDFARGLPPCAGCHGNRAGGPIETPTLAGQNRDYLAAQLRAYASGERRNDIYQRMRSVASRLTPHEIELLALYYSTQP